MMLIIVSGCAKRSQEREMPRVTIAFQDWVGYGLFYLAKEEGFDRKEGIQLNIVNEQLDSARRDAFKAGMLDVEAATLDLLISKVAQGVPLVAVMEIDMSLGSDAIVATEGIRTLEDLIGKKVVFARDDVGETFISGLLYQKGVPFKAVTIEPEYPEKVASAFLTGDADACVTWEPQVSEALKRLGSHILASSKEHPGIIVDTLNVRKDLVENNPGLIKRLMRAWFRTLQFYREHPLEASTIIAPYYHISPAQYRKQIEGLKWDSYEEQATEKENKEWIDAARLLGEVKFANARISRKPDLQTIINHKLILGLYEDRQ
jgi:NitT/TauT family transport system substrate-binding protein